MNDALSALVRLPRPARVPSWRSMLAAERAARAAVRMFDLIADRETARLDAKAQKTVRPARRGAR